MKKLIATGIVLCAAAEAQIIGTEPDHVMFFQQAIPPVPPVPPGTAGVRLDNFQFVSGQLVGNTVKNSPYSAESVMESVQTLPDGNRIVNRTSTKQYRDSEGRERREMSIGGDKASEIVMISDPVAGTHYTLEQSRKVAHKASTPALGPGAFTTAFAATAVPLPPPPPPPPGSAPGGRAMVIRRAETRIAAGGLAPSSDAKEESLGARTIEGVMATGTRRVTVLPAGQIGNERPIEIIVETWYSPDLKMTVLSETIDPRMGKTSMKLTNISRSEPSRSLFEVPAGYTVEESPKMDAGAVHIEVRK